MTNKRFFNHSIFRNLLFLLALFSLLSAKETGCSRMKADMPGQPATQTRSASFLLKKLQAHDLKKVQFLNARAKIRVDGDGQSMSANANIVWVRDSVLWLNVKKFGIEAVRALITKDSVFVINRLNKTWSAKGLESLERTYSLPDGFGFLQQFILASAWLDPNTEMKSDIKDELHRLSGSNHTFVSDYRVEEGSFLLRSQTFMQPKDARNLSLSFDNYRKLEAAGLFPYLRRIEAFSPETGNVTLDIELSDIEINSPKNFRFEIPTYYDKLD